jgi:hypothetical protein
MHRTNSIPKLSRDLAAAKLYAMGVRTASDFHALCSGRFNDEERPADIPSNPVGFYDDVSSFYEFMAVGERAFNRGILESKQDEVMSYQELKALVRKHRIYSIREWKAAVKANELPGKYPTAPHNYYKEFEGWEAFLAPKTARFLSFDDARKVAKQLAQEHGLRTAYHWRWLSRERQRPKDIPASPDQYYPEFVSWKHFYGLNEVI